MATRILTHDNWTLGIERDGEWLEAIGPEADPDWVFTDAVGHEHHRVDHGYPTLTWMIDHVYWCDICQDEHEDGHYECAVCGEVIEPGIRTPSPVWMEGPTSARLTVRDKWGETIYWLTRDQASELVRTDVLPDLPDDQVIERTFTSAP